MADQGNLDGVAIVLLCPSLGTDHHGGDAHCTLVYCGETDKVSLQLASVMDSTTRAMSLAVPVFEVDVIGTALFGDKHNERVLLLDPSRFVSMRWQVAHWNRSTHSFKPHVATAKPQPAVVRFTKIALWYGTKRIEYPLRGIPYREVTVRGPDDFGDEQGGSGRASG